MTFINTLLSIRLRIILTIGKINIYKRGNYSAIVPTLRDVGFWPLFINWLHSMRDFRTLNIWKGGIAIVKQVYRLAAFLPAKEKYGLRSQIYRSAVSIPSNIAESCSREQKMINYLISKLKVKG